MKSKLSVILSVERRGMWKCTWVLSVQER